MVRHKHKGFQLLIFLLLFGLYANWPLHTYTFDSLTYVLDIQSGRLVQMLHPHHMLYSPMGYLFWQLAKMISSSVQVLTVLQILGAFFLALAWLILFNLLLQWEIEFFVALFTSLLAVLTYGPWRFATVTEPYALHVLLVVSLLYLANPNASNSRLSFIKLALAAVIATFNMQTAFLFIPSALILAFGQNKERLRSILKTLGLYMAICFLLYFLFGYMALGDLNALPNWFAKYAVDRRWWDPSPVKLITAFFTASDGIFGQNTSPSIVRTLSWFSLTIVVILAMYHLRSWLKEKAHLTYAAALALTLQFAFYYQFDAGSPCYWTIVPTLLALVLSGPLTIAAREKKLITHSLLLVTLSLGVFTVFTTEIIPQSRKSAYVPYQLAEQTSAIVGNGMLWMMGGNINERVFRVFSPLRIRSIHDILLRGKGSKAENLLLLKSKVSNDTTKGKVFVFGDIYNGSFKGIVGLDNVLIPPDDIAKTFEGFQLHPIPIDGRLFLWEMVKKENQKP